MGKEEITTREKTFLALRIAMNRVFGGTQGISLAVLLGIVAATANAQAAAAHYRFHDGVALNDLNVTPGAIRTTDKKAICNQPPGWTEEFRNTTQALKDSVFAEYGVDKHKFNRALFCTGSVKCDTAAEWAKKNKGHKHRLPMYEIDHLDSLQVAGADVKENLMPQPYYAHPGAHEKDTVENWARKQVCTGKMELPDVQRALATDWYALYLQMKALKPPHNGAD